MAANKPSPGVLTANQTRSVIARVIEDRGELHTPLASALEGGNVLAPFTLRRINTNGLASGDFRIDEDYNPGGDDPTWLAEYIRKAGSASLNGKKGSFLLEDVFGSSHLAQLGEQFQKLASSQSTLSREAKADFLGYFATKRNALIQARLYTAALSALAQMPVDFMRGLDPTSTDKKSAVPPAYKKLLTDYAAFRFADECNGQNPTDEHLLKAHKALCDDADALQLMLRESPQGQQHILNALQQQGEILDHKLRLLDPDAYESCAARIERLRDFPKKIPKGTKEAFAAARKFPSFDLFREVSAKRGNAQPPRYYYPKKDENGHIVINENGQPIFYSVEAPSFGAMIPKIFDAVTDSQDPISFMVNLFTYTAQAMAISRGLLPPSSEALSEEELARGAVASLVASSGFEGHGAPQRAFAKDVLKEAEKIRAEHRRNMAKLQKKGFSHGSKYKKRRDDDDYDGPPSDPQEPDSPPPPDYSGSGSSKSEHPNMPTKNPDAGADEPFLAEKNPKKSRPSPNASGNVVYKLKTGADAPKFHPKSPPPLDKGEPHSSQGKDDIPPQFQPGRN
jgi:hypothetical protein